MSAAESDTKPTPCANCQALQEQIYRLTMERQLLVEQLADERERANALFVNYPPPPRVEVAPPTATDGGAKPLRYQVIDQINEAVCRLPGYELARRFARVLTTS
jgi:hypothetical protein